MTEFRSHTSSFAYFSAFAILIWCDIIETRCILSKDCPKPCSCTVIQPGGIHVDCVKRQLNSIPNPLPNNVVKLDLFWNSVDKIRFDDLKDCFNLESIGLSSNSIKIIDGGAFDSLHKLENLRLSDNKLNFSNTKSFPLNVFESLTKLKLVKIQNNYKVISNHEGLTRVLHEMPTSLQVLYIDVPSDSQKFAEGFSKFTNLTDLGIFGHHAQFSENTLRPLSLLPINDLTISFKVLKSIDPLTLTWFSKLTKLDMTNTGGMNVGLFLDTALRVLKNSSLKILNLQYMKNRDKAELVKVKGSAFRGLFQLEELNLAGTDISSGIDAVFFKNLPNLAYLNLKGNALPADVMKIILSRTRQYRQQLRVLDLSEQVLVTSVSGRKQHQIIIELSPNMSVLDLSKYNLAQRKRITQFKLLYDNKLSCFNFNHCLMGSLNMLFINNPNPNTPLKLDFSGNKLSYINENAMKYGIEHGLCLDQLLLSDNSLNALLSNSQEHTFQHYKDLRTLDLSFNRLKALSPVVFINLTKLEFLNLSSNSLNLISFQLSHMSNLQTLDISNNLLTQLHPDFRETLDKLKLKSPTLTIHLDGNPLQCSCDTLDFLHWIANPQQLVIPDYQTYTCVFQNSERKFSDLPELLSKLNYSCSLDLIVKVSAGVLSFIVFVIAFSVVLYRHRWDVKFFCIRFAIRRNEYQTLEEEASVEYEYDAFVAYHKDSLGWVKNELFENLSKKENAEETGEQSGFRLCIHDLNFIPGIAIEENIVRAVETSRKTILVLNKSFLKSVWCEFEFHMARNESMKKGRNLVIAVMLEDLPEQDMSRSLRLLIRKNTYIEWSDDPEKKKKFWQNMRTALQNENKEGYVCECGRTMAG